MANFLGEKYVPKYQTDYFKLPKSRQKLSNGKKDENKFSIIIYCLEENININKETELLNKLFKKHGLC